MTGGLISALQSCYNSPASAAFSPSQFVKPRVLHDSTEEEGDFIIVAEMKSMEDLIEDEEGDSMNVTERKLLENLIEDGEEGGDSMIVAEKKSLKDLMEDEDDIAMNIDADFSVQLECLSLAGALAFL